MLQNAYFIAKIGADTAENEQHFAPGSRWQSLLRAVVGANVGSRWTPLVPQRAGAARCSVTQQRFENAFFENAFFENAFFENAFFENFANFWRARSWLYQNEIL